MGKYFNRQVNLKHLFINKENYIGISFRLDKVLGALTKSIKEIGFSEEYSCYYLLNNEENLNIIFNTYTAIKRN